MFPKHFDYDFLLGSDDLKDIEEYKIISSVLSELCKSGALLLAKGYCISVSEMISDALLHKGIKSELIECKLAITNSETGKISFIG